MYIELFFTAIKYMHISICNTACYRHVVRPKQLQLKSLKKYQTGGPMQPYSGRCCNDKLANVYMMGH